IAVPPERDGSSSSQVATLQGVTAMSKSNGLSFLRRFFLKSRASPRRGKTRSRFVPQLVLLEDRCVPAAPVLTPTKQLLSEVLYTDASVPQKLITIFNNTEYTQYPILTDSNSTRDAVAATTHLSAEITNTATSLTVDLTAEEAPFFPVVGQFAIKIDG